MKGPMKKIPLPLRADGYKFGHWQQFPDEIEMSDYYFESRGGEYDHNVVVGLQYYLQQYLSEPVTMEDVEYSYKKVIEKGYGTSFPYEGWKYIVEKHGGRLPVQIRAVREGTILKGKNVIFKIRSTDKKCAWLPGYLETLLQKVWYPTTVATISWSCKNIIRRYLKETANDLSELDFKLHDFGCRGTSSEESAMIGASAHLAVFRGTDTFIANELLEHHYEAGISELGCSINATEHSSTTIYGREKEFDAYRKQLTLYKGKMFSSVIDSYDPKKAIAMWAQMKQEIMDSETTLVIRPDSGDPVEMSLSCAKWVEEQFDTFTNLRGFKEFRNVKIIYGDGISKPSVIAKILENLKVNGFSANIIAFGMGGGLLQKCDRDTSKFALKMSGAVVGGQNVLVFKDPVTDPGKKSKKGFLDLTRDLKGNYITKEYDTPVEMMGTCLVTVYENGKVLKPMTWREVKDNLKAHEEMLDLV